MVKAEVVRDFFKQNPEATVNDAVEALANEKITKRDIGICLKRDVDRGWAVKLEDGTYQYLDLQAEKSNAREIQEWKQDIRKQLVEQLMAANNIETDSNQIRLNAKAINQLLLEI